MMSSLHTGRGRGRALAAAVSLAALLGTAACSGDDEPDTDDPVETTEAPTPEDRLAQAREVLTDAGSVSLEMTGSNLPEDLDNYIIKAVGSGTMDPPAFEGTITANVSGIQADVPTIAFAGELHVQLPFTPDYITTKPEDLNVPDPAKLFDPEEGIVSLLTTTEDAAFGDQSREGREIVQQVTGTLPGQAVVDLLGVGDAEGTFEVTYGLVEESWEARTVTITGPFYPPADSTYALTLDDFGTPVTIEAP